MNSQRIRRLERIFHGASELDETERSAFLERECRGDEELRKEVDSLLVQDGETQDFLESSALMEMTASLAAGYSEDRGIEDMIGRYRILEMVGSGGMGRVYKAEDTHLDRQVAIKMLPPGLISDKKIRPRFIREAKAASSLNHPNIITIYDIGRAGDVDFIAMEFVDGHTLRNILSRRTLTLTETLDYAAQITRALYAAHRAGIIHRDIKPENLMVTSAPSLPGQVKVLDFGLAKYTQLHRQNEKDDVNSVRGTILGTVPYMAPEQAEGQALDARADIFSTGAVMYEMLSGRKAFQGETYISILNAVLRKDPEPLTGIPVELWNIIACCLNKSPDLRFQDARELEAALTSCRPFIADFSYRTGTTVYPIKTDTGQLSKTMLVVLPFHNISDDKDQDYFSDGLTEEMITELGRLNPDRLGVIARTTAMQVRSLGKGIADIGNELGVHFILEGSVRKAGDRVRITVQLIQTRNQASLWTSTYDRHLKNILDIQQDVAERTARSLAMELLPYGRNVRPNIGSRVSDAHELYLRGLYYWSLRTEPSFRTAIQFLEKSIELDPEYAQAHSALASVYNSLGLYGGIPPDLARNRATDHANKALDIDDTLAAAHTSLGYTRLLFDWDWENSETAFQTAIRNNPNYIEGHQWYSFRLAMLGEFGKAEQQMDMALKLDPLSFLLNTHKGWIYYFSRRYEDAVSQLHYAIQLKDNFELSHYFLGLAFLQMDRLEDAVREFGEARELSGNHPAPCAGLGYAYGRLGRNSEVHRFRDELENLAAHRHVSPYFHAWLHLGLGDEQAALTQLEKSYEQRCGWMAHLKVDPVMDPLRSNPLFQKLLLRVGFAPNAG